MAKFPEVKVEKRTLFGRKVGQLRSKGILPANLFGNKIESIGIQINEKEFIKTFKEVGETGLVQVVVDDKKYPSLIAGFAKNPVTDKILHVDFHHVSLKEKVTASIPLEIIGESAAVKDFGGILFQSLNEVEVEALPTDLPESIEVDITSLVALGDSLTVADLKLDTTKITVKAEEDTMVVSIQAPAKEEEVVATEETPKEAEVIGKEASTEESKEADAS